MRWLFGAQARNAGLRVQTGRGQAGGIQAEAGNGIELGLDELLRLRLNVGKSAGRQRKRVLTPRSANQRSRALGRGLDFAEVRAYQPGDDVRMIDWNVTARTNQVHTKLFEEEKERPVFIVVDFCQPMLFGTRVALKSVAAARLAAQLAWIFAAAGERIGGLVFADHRHCEIKPLGGSRGCLRLLKTLVDMHRECLLQYHLSQDPVAQTQQPLDSTSGQSALGAALLRLRKVAHPGSLVLLLSDFAGLSAQDESVLKGLCIHTECTAVRVVDELESHLPEKGLYPVTDGTSRAHFDAAQHAVREAHQGAFTGRNTQLAQLLSGHSSYFAQYTATVPPAQAVQRLLQRSAITPTENTAQAATA